MKHFDKGYSTVTMFPKNLWEYADEINERYGRDTEEIIHSLSYHLPNDRMYNFYIEKNYIEIEAVGISKINHSTFSVQNGDFEDSVDNDYGPLLEYIETQDVIEGWIGVDTSNKTLYNIDYNITMLR